MSRMCELCEKRSNFGQVRSYSARATKHRRKPNTQRRTLEFANGQRLRTWICTRCIHTHTKKHAP